MLTLSPLVVIHALMILSPVDVGEPQVTPPDYDYLPLVSDRLLTSGLGRGSPVGFGQVVHMDDGVIYVGAPDWDRPSSDGAGYRYSSGRVYAYDELSGSLRWVFEGHDGDRQTRLGDSVAARANLLVTNSLFSPGEPLGIELTDTGDFELLAVLAPDSGSDLGAVMGARIAGDRVLFTLTNYSHLGSNGDGVTYLYDLSTFEQLASFESDPIIVGDARSESLAIDDECIVVGDSELVDPKAPYETFGRVLVYDARTLELRHELVSPERTPGFGSAVAMNSAYIAVAQSLGPQSDWGEDIGTVDLFDKQTGELVWRFTPADVDRMYGNAIAMNERFVCVTSVWTRATYLIEIDNPDRVHRLSYRDEPGDREVGYPLGGFSLAMNERTLAVGGRGGRPDEFVAIYRLDCPADFTHDRQVSSDDVLAFLGYWNAADLAADLNEDGRVDPFDIFEYVELAGQSCP